MAMRSEPAQQRRTELLERFAVERLGRGDLERLRLVLRGDSVIDWKRLHFRERSEVDHFLRANLLDPEDLDDERRLRAILAQSVEYLRRTFKYKVTKLVAEPEAIQDLFLYASGALEPKRLSRIACVVLKVMHTVHHIEARELLHRTRVSEAELSRRVDQRVREVLHRLSSEERLGIVSFEGNSKTRQSVITKLIAKRENVAAQIYDRHRYRVVVSDVDAVVTTVMALASELFPFNYVVPGQTQNTLVTLRDLVERHPSLSTVGARLVAEELAEEKGSNEFSGGTYRILNFIVDLPLKIAPAKSSRRRSRSEDLGRVVFVPVELQVVDEATATTNEVGENSHKRYKQRQLRRVLTRLSRGLVVPRRRGPKPTSGA